MTTPITFRTLTIDGGVILGGKPVTTLRAADGYAMTWDPGTPWVRVQPPAGLSPVALSPLLIPVARCHGEEEPMANVPTWLPPGVPVPACIRCTVTQPCPAHWPEGWGTPIKIPRELIDRPVAEPLSREPEPKGVLPKAGARKGSRPKR